jgi:hypothetical protein
MMDLLAQRAALVPAGAQRVRHAGRCEFGTGACSGPDASVFHVGKFGIIRSDQPGDVQVSASPLWLLS